MCRSLAEGGRRCPAHTNPETIRQYNQIRRERYHARKHQPGDSFIKPLTVTPNPSERYSATGQTITGTLTTEILKTLPEDYFGFDKALQKYYDLEPIPGEGPHAARAKEIKNYQETEKLNNINFNDEETNFLYHYTDNLNRKLHKYLINGPEDPALQPDEYQATINPDLLEEYKNIENPTIDQVNNMVTVFDDWISENALKQAIRVLDGALEKAPKVQRVVYRGLPIKNNFIPEFTERYNILSSEEFDTKYTEHLEKHVNIGQELVFDGYLSSTELFQMGHNFSQLNDTYTVCEILTPNGAHISHVSSYAAEVETLLPRGQRYKIVGMKKRKASKTDKAHTLVPYIYTIQMVAINSKGEILDGTNDDPLPPLPGENQNRDNETR